MIGTNLPPELEENLYEKATHQAQDITIIATELLTSILEWEMQELKEAVKVIQQGLDNFEAGNFRPFNEFC